jgi:hypothetical protein
MATLTPRKQITARQIMAAMDYDTVAAYLTQRGWGYRTDQPKGKVFAKGGGENTYQVCVPFDRALRDYPLIMLHALRGIALAEDKGEVAVVKELRVMSLVGRAREL